MCNSYGVVEIIKQLEISIDTVNALQKNYKIFEIGILLLFHPIADEDICFALFSIKAV